MLNTAHSADVCAGTSGTPEQQAGRDTAKSSIGAKKSQRVSMASQELGSIDEMQDVERCSVGEDRRETFNDLSRDIPVSPCQPVQFGNREELP